MPVGDAREPRAIGDEVGFARQPQDGVGLEGP
jgi:hypothetical protein